MIDRLIPKKIHYCWFGNNPLSDLATRCLESWQKYCPDYEIVRWDETNCDLGVNQFVQQAYEAGKWAFVSDYYRLKVIEENGGIYLDTDVELLKPLDEFLSLDGFMGFEMGERNHIATGLGFGAKPNHPVITQLRQAYETIPFILPDGSYDETPCPRRDTKSLVEMGLVQDGAYQQVDGMTLFPADYLSPISVFGDETFTENTASIHHYAATWHTSERRRKREIRTLLVQWFGMKLGSRIYTICSGIIEIKYNGFRSFLKKFKAKVKNIGQDRRV